jgi:hypothetical protein
MAIGVPVQSIYDTESLYMCTVAASADPVSRTKACEPDSPELAISALQRTKGCTVTTAGTNDCALAFPTSLDAVTVEDLVCALVDPWESQTVSRLAAHREGLRSGGTLPAASRKSEAA